ncbi:MAG: polymer-forming cytoskeletal protein [Treponema sp.]|jgi:cytoskeletal protein CcmA (bactofilin family)|nr:polymer-forming cytoskeletal protein [Treponema sp.]
MNRSFRPKKEVEFSINTIVGPGSFVRGDIDSGGFTRVDGNVKGNIHARGRVVVGRDARMRSSITGTNITVGGIVDGNIMASERLVILPTAIVLGDITTRRIEVNEGSMISGRVRVCQSDDSWQRAAQEYRDKRRG